MKVLIPMAGTGNRFVQAGYQEPKPLISVSGKRIIEYILDMEELGMHLLDSLSRNS